MAEHHVQMGIATASPRCHVRDITKYYPAFFQLFDHIISGEKGIRSKPFPDIFLLSAKRFEDVPDPKDVSIRRISIKKLHYFSAENLYKAGSVSKVPYAIY